MEQHPIPQNISSYEFRLVGDMTLKQFFQLASGIIVGLIFYRLPLTNFIKFPLIFVAVMIGVALAFIPINGRPFSRWIVAFLRAIYSPTEFIWQQSSSETIQSPVNIQSPVSDLNSQIKPPVPAILPDATPTVDTLPSSVSVSKSNETDFVKVSSVSPPPTKSEPETTVFSSASPVPESPEVLAPSKPDSSLLNLNVQISNLPPVLPPQTKVIPPPVTGPATTTNQLASPTTPNILSGIITQSDSSPIEGAIVEIIDSTSGIPARALRTNRLGQFQIATPLTPGTYTLQTEKDGFTFTPVSVVVDNHIVTPVIITGQIV